jgi:hypothetical protein
MKFKFLKILVFGNISFKEENSNIKETKLDISKILGKIAIFG